jgi:phosphoribosyl 1,2-cyclic phosphate phosphodiesterase
MTAKRRESFQKARLRRPDSLTDDMRLTILGSGGCAVIPKPLCGCAVCREAREKGGRFRRTGPSIFVHGENILIDTPAEIAFQINRSRIERIDFLLFTHLDPDHTEGLRVVEQIALDFRTWQGYEEKRIRILLPEPLNVLLRNIRSVYGPLIDFYEAQGFVEREVFDRCVRIGDVRVTAIEVNRRPQTSFVYVFEEMGKRAVYAPCDIKPFPEDDSRVKGADLLVIQPGIFETGLKHGFAYPSDHISRSTLYTFEDTLALAERIEAKRVLFVHLEEYWNRSYSDYAEIETRFSHIRFAYDGMDVSV